MSAISLEVNGKKRTLDVEPRRLLADVLRTEFGLSGVHIGCAHGACGCCTVHIGGVPRLSCLSFAVQYDGASITTVESIGNLSAERDLLEAFRSEHGLQCGYCTPGFIMTLLPFVATMVGENRMPDGEEIREAMSGNICRCTGYHGIVSAVRKTIGNQLAAVKG
jgi:aerobic-type carbon monoxide dehydrogenase small subunit (CoxS/CutS family)